jgi:hypothetical protein
MSDSIDPRPQRSPTPASVESVADPIPAKAIAPVPAVRAPAPNFTPAKNAALPTVKPREEIDGLEKPVYGDKAGEYRWMERGRFDAWIHVGIAFLYQILIVGGAIGGGAAAIVSKVTDSDGDAALYTLLIVGGIVGITGAYFTFRDRWRVNEAFSSRFCSGLANLSIMYVPFVAFIYGNYRAIQKFRGK